MSSVVAALALTLSLAACNEAQTGNDDSASQGPILPIGLSGSQGVSAQDVTGEYLADPGDGENWPSVGNGYANNRFSKLDTLTPDNLSDFGMIWSAPLAEDEGRLATPIAVDGRIYLGDPVHGVTSWEAVGGQRIWNYNPEIAAPVLDGLDCTARGPAGVAVARGRIFFGQRDGRLTALDASTGAVLWSSQTGNGTSNAIVGVPLVVGNHVVVGSAPPCGQSATDAAPRGYVSGYVAQDGQLGWRFYTVPTEAQVSEAMGQGANGLLADAARSWQNETSAPGGGFVPGNIAFDAMSGDLLFGTGPRLPQPTGTVEGRGLFTSSLIAIDPETGRYRWHRQLAPGGMGWSANAPILFASLPLPTEAEDREEEEPGGGESPQRQVRAAWLPLENGWLVAATQSAGYLGFAARYGGGFSPVERYDGETQTALLSEEARERRPEAIHDSWRPASYSPATGYFYLHRSAVGGSEDRDAVRETLIAYDPAKKRVAWRAGGAGAAPLVTAGGLLFARYDAPFAQGLAIFDARTGDRLYYRADIVPIGGFATYLSAGKQLVSFPALMNGKPQMVTMGLGGRARLDNEETP